MRSTEAARAGQRLRRAAFVRGVRWLAARAGGQVDLDVDLTVRVGRRVRVVVAPGTTTTVRIGAHTVLGDDVALLLKGGELLVGQWCDLRRGVVLNVAGRLELAGHNVVSYYSTLQCAASIRLAEQASVGDHATLVDSSHYYSAPDRRVIDNVRVGGIDVGANSLVCANATLTRRARVGAHAIVAAGSVVVGEVPDGHLASGVPARIVRPLPLPWQDADVASQPAG